MIEQRVLELNEIALVSHERDPKLQEMSLEIPKNYLVLQSSYVQLKGFFSSGVLVTTSDIISPWFVSEIMKEKEPELIEG